MIISLIIDSFNMRQLMSNTGAVQEVNEEFSDNEVSPEIAGASTQLPSNDDTAIVEIVNDSE